MGCDCWVEGVEWMVSLLAAEVGGRVEGHLCGGGFRV